MNNNKKYIIGIDIGGTTCKMALFTMNMKMLKKWSIDTDTKNHGKNIIKKCVASIMLNIAIKDIDKNDIYGIGVAVPGPVLDDAVITKAINIGWNRPCDIKKELKKYFLSNTQIKVANDVNAAGLGEYNVIDNKNIKSFVMVSMGTGIGGGLIYDGKIVAGKNGSAMEIGHIRVDDSYNAKRCNCGSRGCAETFGGTNHIKESFISNLKNKKLYNIKSVFRKYKKEDYKNIDTKEICNAAKKGNKLCILTLKENMYKVGKMFASLILTLDPDMIVIGGGISKGGAIITKYIKDGIKDNMKMIEKIPAIKISMLKSDAGIYGAGYLVIK
ncbi:MAG: ROK family protein [Lachnospiraceae bacterium]|nr:ROK family protein [Lachnospiraceae bacterium]